MATLDPDRLSTAALDSERLLQLARYGEDLVVERKARFPEPEKLGDVVASMANSVGGWILLGVEDGSGTIVDWAFPDDLQSHVGNLLRRVLDPVPPFLADTREVKGTKVGFIRVPRSTALVLTSSGSVYTRDAGKRPVTDQRDLLGLAQRARADRGGAAARPNAGTAVHQDLGLPLGKRPQVKNHLQIAVTATPLVVTPDVERWAIARGPGDCDELAAWLAPGPTSRWGQGSQCGCDRAPRGSACSPPRSHLNWIFGQLA